MLILAFGLLAMVGLGASAVQYSKMAQYLATASDLAADYADRARSNPDGFIADGYNRIVYQGERTIPSVTTCGDPNNLILVCTPAQIATYDMTHWLATLRRQLPAGDAIARRQAPAAPGGTSYVDLWLLWQDPAINTSWLVNGVCPTEVDSVTPRPRCLYFRIAL